MVPTQGIPSDNPELLSKLGLQFFDLDRWPEADEGYQNLFLFQITGWSNIFTRVGRETAESYTKAHEKFARALTIPAVAGASLDRVCIDESKSWPDPESDPHTGPPVDHFRKRGKHFKR